MGEKLVVNLTKMSDDKLRQLKLRAEKEINQYFVKHNKLVLLKYMIEFMRREGKIVFIKRALDKIKRRDFNVYRSSCED